MTLYAWTATESLLFLLWEGEVTFERVREEEMSCLLLLRPTRRDDGDEVDEDVVVCWAVCMVQLGLVVIVENCMVVICRF